MTARLLLLGLINLFAVYLLLGWRSLDEAQRQQLYDTPRLTAPASGAVVSTTQPLLTWRNPASASFYELQVRPMSRRASIIHMYGAAVSSFQVPAPPQWCCIEPDTLYFWRVRVSFEEEPLTPEDDGWGPWAEGWFFVSTPPFGTELGAPDVTVQ